MSSEPGPAASDPVVRTQHLGKCYHIYARPQDRLRQFFARAGKRFYREFWALKDCNLEVHRGETLGIVGRNGAGKSTLLQLIAGTLKPTTGDVGLHGRVTALLELGSGFHQDFTGRENVYVAGALLGLDREQMDARMERITSFADIGEFFDRPVKTYSRGMFARLSFSVYANLDPEVFIVDEALAVGDARFRHKCMYRFRQMQEQGVAVLYVSHDAASMKHLCDRVAWIDEGNLMQVGDPSPVVDAYLNHIFHGQPPPAAGRPGAKAAAPPPVRGDDDIGSGLGRFVTCELRHEDGRPADHATAGDALELRLRLRNDGAEPGSDPWMVGFSISNVHGLAITGVNSLANGVELPLPPRGGVVAVRFRFRLPQLVPGNYAITLTAVTLDADGVTHPVHVVPNALHFLASHPRKVFGLLGVDCDVEAALE